MGHLGTRVTALLDGRLLPAEEERAWDHVHACHPCQDAVEREGWVKTRLVQFGCTSRATSPSSLRESLLNASFAHAAPDAWVASAAAGPSSSGSSMRTRHLASFGGGALGVAVVGVIALGAAPANAPQADRRGPLTSVVPASSLLDAGVRTTPQRPRATASVRRISLGETMAP